MWYRIGRGPTRDYYYANVDLIRASQISMAASFALFMAGLAAPGLSDLVHGELMTMGLLSFYLSVMYLQHPAWGELHAEEALGAMSSSPCSLWGRPAAWRTCRSPGRPFRRST
jgi:hypothetical protein